MNKVRRTDTPLLFMLVTALLVATVASNANAQASPYPLQVVNIKPAGTGTPVLPAANRIFHAYPGIEYNIRAGVIGGTFPYQFSLTNAPPGMVVNAQTGEISWPNPAQNAGPIVLNVRDSAGAAVQATWSISVHTTGFWFVDRDHTGTSTGSITQPFKSLLELVQNTQSRSGDIVYLRGSTSPYTVVPYPPASSPGYDDAFHFYAQANSYARAPEQVLAYPGEFPVIDLENLNYIRTDKPYFDGLEIRNALQWGVMALGGANYMTVRRTKFDGITTSSGVNNNQGQFFTIGDGYGSFGVFQDNEFTDFVGANGLGSLYHMNKVLIENNHTHDGGFPGLHAFASPIGLKVGNLDVTMRGNIIEIPAGARHLEMYNANSGSGALDFSYNLIKRSGTGLAIEFFDPANVHMYRNTVIGNILFNPGTDTHSSQGPYYMQNNVIQGSLVNPTYVTQSNNLLGGLTAGFVDARGNLTGSYTQYLGIRGYQLGASTEKTPISPPAFEVR